MAGRTVRPELADVVRQFGRELLRGEGLSPGQTKALFNILRCRTSALGGHEEKCDSCGTLRYSYNSCGDRHCPKCQGTKQAIWIEKLIAATLPVKHFHIIFTVPHCLNGICLWDAGLFYNVLFHAAWQTLRSFGYTHYGAETGAVAILHSWGQNLSLHPHLHCIVPAAGYTLRGEWINIGRYENYLYPVHQLGSAFKGRFLYGLKRKLRKADMLAGFNSQLAKASGAKWVVYCEASLAGREQVVRYLGQYTHRVAISNHRILGITKDKVTFIAKDYRDRATKKPVELDGVEFLRRFCMHVLPKRFVRIRRYGIYNARTIRNMELQFVPEPKADIGQLEKGNEKETAQQRIKRLTGFDIGQCPICKTGRMQLVRKLPRIRAPPGHLPSLLARMLL